MELTIILSILGFLMGWFIASPFKTPTTTHQKQEKTERDERNKRLQESEDNKHYQHFETQKLQRDLKRLLSEYT